MAWDDITVSLVCELSYVLISDKIHRFATQRLSGPHTYFDACVPPFVVFLISGLMHDVRDNTSLVTAEAETICYNTLINMK